MNELQKLLKLKHSNVIGLKGIVKSFNDRVVTRPAGGPSIIMEYCRESLEHVSFQSFLSTLLLKWRCFLSKLSLNFDMFKF